MSPSEYQAYLASREWALLKEQIRHRSRNRCERCHEAPYQQTHHLTYERIGHEWLDDLLAVCSDCHKFLSGKTDVDPRQQHADWLVACPVCGFDYSHVRSVFTRMGRDSGEAKVYDGTEARGTTLSRRSALVVIFDGECEHSWELEIQQHKGRNFVSHHIVPGLDDARYSAAVEMARLPFEDTAGIAG